jgi:ABC-type sugar transport system substrate-binding protein
MKKRKLTVLALAFASACGSNNSSTTTTTTTATKTSTTTNPDAAVSTPGSAFIPQNIEGVVNALVAATQATKKDPNATPVEVILKQTDGYFAPMVVGANRITSRLGCPGNVEAALVPQDDANADQVNKEKTDSQNALIESYATNSSYKAMGLSPLGSDTASVTAFNDFIAKRGPIVMMDSDAPTSNRAYYVGTDNISAGKTAGKELRKVLNAGDAMAVFGNTDPGWQSGLDRANGAEQGAQEAGLTVTPRIPTVWNHDTDLNAIKTALQDPTLNIKGLVCCYSNSYVCAEAVDALGLKGKVQIVGFDITSDTKPWFDKGLFHALMAQRAYYMGVLGALIPYSISVIGADATATALQPLIVGPGLVDTGLDIVTSDAYADYMSYLSSLGVNG